MAALDVPTLVIRELTGGQRTLRLSGRALPYRGLAMGTSQRVEVEWLPGSPVGTSTLLGPTEDPLTINGVWKAKYVIANTGRDEVGRITSADGVMPPLTLNDEVFLSVATIVEVCEDFVRMGQELEVSWGPVLRRGFWKTFKPTWLTLNDVEWSASFEWVSRGETAGPLVVNTIGGFGDLAAATRAQQDALDALEAPPFGLTDSLLSGLQAIQAALQDGLLLVVDTITGVTTGINNVARAVRGIAASLVTIGETALELVNFIDAQLGTADTITTGPGATPGQGGVLGKPYDAQDEATKIKVLVFIAAVKAAAWDLRWWAAEQLSTLPSVAASDIQQVVIAGDEDLQAIATSTLGSPFAWRRIAAFNGFDSPLVSPGTVVLIPAPSVPVEGC